MLKSIVAVNGTVSNQLIINGKMPTNYLKENNQLKKKRNSHKFLIVCKEPISYQALRNQITDEAYDSVV